MDVSPMISATGKNTDWNSHRLIEASPTKAEVQWKMVNMQQMLPAHAGHHVKNFQYYLVVLKIIIISQRPCVRNLIFSITFLI